MAGHNTLPLHVPSLNAGAGGAPIFLGSSIRSSTPYGWAQTYHPAAPAHPSLPQVHPQIDFGRNTDARPNKVLPNGSRPLGFAPPAPANAPVPTMPFVPNPAVGNNVQVSPIGVSSHRRGSLPIRIASNPDPAAATHHGRWPSGRSESIAASGFSRRSFPQSISGRSTTSCGSVIDGKRMDDGWNGSRGRVHNGFEPDLTSAAGRLGPLAGMAGAAGDGWERVPPASWQPQLRPSLGHVYPSSPLARPPGRSPSDVRRKGEWSMCSCACGEVGEGQLLSPADAW